MPLFLRRSAQLLASLVLALIVMSCSEVPPASAPTAAKLPVGGPSMGYAPVFGCDNLTPATMCEGTLTTQEVRIEQLRVCKVYANGASGPDVQINLTADYVQFQSGPQSGTYTLTNGECRILWRNGEYVGSVRSTDLVTVSETPVPGYTTSMQVTTILRDQELPGGPSTFTTTVGPVTNATSYTAEVGGRKVPGALVVFINTPIPANTQPTPIHNGPYVGVEGSSVSFSSAGTNDPEGDPLTYLWSFGDGGTSTAQNPTHTYADNGVYPVTLTVDDGSGPQTVNTTATITNVNPVPVASITASVVCGQVASFTGSFTDAGINDQTWTWSINWGDGSPSTTGGNATMAAPIAATHAYATNGSYTVTLTVTDKDGGVGTATTTVVRSCPPVTGTCVAINALQGAAITPVTITGSGGAGAPYTFSATGLPAGLSMSAGGTISGTPTASGTFPYVVTITDKDGNAGTINCSVTVGTRPTASCVSITAVKGTPITPVSVVGAGGAGAPYTYSATGLPAGLTMSASGTISGTATVTGSFTYTVTITDRNGVQGTITCTIMVTTPPDTTAPVCSVHANAAPPYMSYQDAGSGIVKLQVVTNLNKNYKVTISPAPAGMTISGGQANGSALVTGTIITFPAGQTALIKTTAVRVLSGVASQLTIKAWDAGGLNVTCDPIETTVTRLKQDNGVQTFYGVPYEEHFVTIENGGLKSLEIEVNGRTFKVKRLDDNEVRVVDISSAMKPGNNNTITLVPKGKKGESADVTIGPDDP